MTDLFEVVKGAVFVSLLVGGIGVWREYKRMKKQEELKEQADEVARESDRIRRDIYARSLDSLVERAREIADKIRNKPK